MDFSMRIVENDQELLSEIIAALDHIDNGTFGVCESCLESGFAATSYYSKIPAEHDPLFPKSHSLRTET